MTAESRRVVGLVGYVLAVVATVCLWVLMSGCATARWMVEPLPGESWAHAGTALDVASTVDRLGDSCGSGCTLVEANPLLGETPTDTEIVLGTVAIHYLVIRPIFRGVCSLGHPKGDERRQTCMRWAMRIVGGGRAAQAGLNWSK